MLWTCKFHDCLSQKRCENPFRISSLEKFCKNSPHFHFSCWSYRNLQDSQFWEHFWMTTCGQLLGYPATAIRGHLLCSVLLTITSSNSLQNITLTLQHSARSSAFLFIYSNFYVQVIPNEKVNFHTYSLVV